MKEGSSILYIKPSNSTFILVDEEILKRHFKVTSYNIKYGKNSFWFLWELKKLTWFLLFHASKRDGIVTWFGDYHSMVVAFIGKLFGKRTVIFAGGQEAIFYPEMRKGVYFKKFRGMCVRYALKHADLIIANHKSLIYHENFYYTKDGKRDGMKYYIPDLTTRIEVIANGWDKEIYNRDYLIEKQENLVLTVGKTNSIADLINKGFDLFVEVAKRNPKLEFVIIAINEDHIALMEEKYKISELKNLKMIPYFCPMETMLNFYNKAKVFVQASITEGMPNTLGEAMLIECVPVGSDVNGIPDVIGETGVIIKKRNVEELEKAIYAALKMNTGKEARVRIEEEYGVDKREKSLIEVLGSL